MNKEALGELAGYEDEMDEKEISWATVAAIIIFTIIVDACGFAFLYKVWNERQMTHEYHAQAVALRAQVDELSRIAAALESK